MSYSRDITLPEGVKEDQIEASLRDGVLQVTVRGGTKVGGPARIEVRL